MRRNVTSERIRRGEVVIGCALQHFRSAEIPRLFAAAGFDYLFIDAEHGGFDLETIQDMVSSAVHSGITPLVRVCELHGEHGLLLEQAPQTVARLREQAPSAVKSS